jgi:hypothetical protein
MTTTSSDYTAKIRAKGLDGTGLTETHAAELFNRVGHTFTAIVELQVTDKHGPNLKGQRGIELVITTLEPALDNDPTIENRIEDHLREIARTLYYNRAIDDAQPTLDPGDGINPKVSDVIAAGVRHHPHPYLASTLSTDDDAICDVCGLIETAGVHYTQDFLPTNDEEPPADNDQDEGDPEPDNTTTGEAEHVPPVVVDQNQQRHLNTVPNPFTTT